MAAAVGPSPRESVVVEHPRHDVVHARRLDKLLALEVIIVRHVQPESFVQPIISFKSLSRKKNQSINQYSGNNINRARRKIFHSYSISDDEIGRNRFRRSFFQRFGSVGSLTRVLVRGRWWRRRSVRCPGRWSTKWSGRTWFPVRPAPACRTCASSGCGKCSPCSHQIWFISTLPTVYLLKLIQCVVDASSTLNPLQRNNGLLSFSQTDWLFFSKICSWIRLEFNSSVQLCLVNWNFIWSLLDVYLTANESEIEVYFDYSSSNHDEHSTN